MTVELKLVERSMTAGGVTAANFPQALRNFRRSAAEATSVSSIGTQFPFAAALQAIEYYSQICGRK
jgi:hypothetical protein